MDEQPVMRVHGLAKSIGKRTIVRDITFDVYPGEVFGFLGPNGAGKTTTIRMLVGLVKPTAGTVEICGYDIRQHFQEAMRHIGCIVENPEMYRFLTGRENLQQFARMLGDIDETRIQEVAELVGLDKRIDDKVKTYSLGMRQRLGIAQALLAKPKLLILDEPTNGLDPNGIRELREFVKKLAAEEGIAVFVSSHILSEMELMCDRVAIIHEGRVLRVGKVADLLYGESRKIAIHTDETEHALRMIHQFLQELQTAEHDAPPTVWVEEGQILCDLKPAWIPDLNRWLVEHGVKIFAIQPKVPTLEELFLGVTGGNTIA
jgi:ABC-2 type transport system ATP-binding protein